jgi:hypothetical protein
MITLTTRLPYSYGKRIKLKPIFDVHLGNTACDTKAFKEYLAKDYDPEDTFFIGGGDLTDSVVTTDKRYQKSVDGTTGDAIIDEQLETAYDYLKPYASNIIGMSEGNHEQVITKKCGTNPAKRICSMLNVPYLGYSSLIGITVYDRDNEKRCMRIVTRTHHGWGGGSRTRGSDITKYEKDVGHWDADIYMYGHVHKKQIDRVPRLGLANGKLIAKPQLFCICGTFLKTYTMSSDSTYSERGGYPPVEIGGVMVYITPGKKSGFELTGDI